MTKIKLKKNITDEIDRNAELARRYKEMFDNSEGEDIVKFGLYGYYMGRVCAYMNVLSIIDLKNSSSPDVISDEEVYNIQQSALLCSKE